ncbi:hypothetical protein LCGC14_2947930 [marine sediment metagenome]|uniref:Uncharacterized protein n=1 Tax=marine sediment metagenome TaxID=412755 RepID=A0A0F9A7A7_9ZZZZ
MRKQNIFDKIWRHERDDEGDFGSRAFLHIPVGIYMGLFPFSRGLRELFIRYEENEDKHVADEAWKDYAGAMVGYVIGRTMFWVALVGLVVWLVSR